MDFLGIGPLELVFIFIVVLLVLGPKDMIKTGSSIGNFVRKVVNSDGWKAIQTAQREMRTLPNKLAHEAGIDDLKKNTIRPPKPVKPKPKPESEIGEIVPELKAWTTTPEEQDDIAEDKEKGDEE